ncbi:MAG: ribose transport system permease protein, partial [Frankiales bacterium]|nr:ribose transport system permease protein [Frankiales bacterium]
MSTRNATLRRISGQGGAMFSKFGLLVMLVLLTVLFSVLKPNTFATTFNFQSIGLSKSIVALLALAAAITISTGEFDVSIGYSVGLFHVLAIGFQTRNGMPWPVAVVSVLALGAVVGLANGLLVTRAYVSSFIATLGSGTLLYGITQWYTHGQQVAGTLGGGFTRIGGLLGPIPVPVIIVVVLSAGLWVLSEYLPIGRMAYVVGSNRKAAELTGISTRKVVLGAFVASGVLSSLAGVVLAAELGVGVPGTGSEFLLPAFAAALLGSTAIRPGRANVLGCLIAVALLAVGVSGLQQLGASTYVDPLFNGAVLILAVSLTSYAGRRLRARTKSGAGPEPVET